MKSSFCALTCTEINTDLPKEETVLYDYNTSQRSSTWTTFTRNVSGDNTLGTRLTHWTVLHIWKAEFSAKNVTSVMNLKASWKAWPWGTESDTPESLIWIILDHASNDRQWSQQNDVFGEPRWRSIKFKGSTDENQGNKSLIIYS